MKVLYHHRIRSKDGQYVHVEELIGALRGLGHEINIVGPSGMEGQRFGGESRTVGWLKHRVPQAIYELLEFGYCFLDCLRLAYAIVRYKPEVIYERFNLYLPSGIWMSKTFKIPLFLEVNAPLYEERSRYDGIALESLARWTQRYTWRGATKCLPVTQALSRYLVDAGVPESDIVVIPNGISESMLSPAGNGCQQLIPESMRGTTILGFVGFVRSWHGMDSVIRLIAEPEFVDHGICLLVVGDGPARSSLEEQARELNIAERVYFTGIVEREQIRAYLELFDIALQPMVVSYASPLKVFEYLAVGCAIVAPDVPNIREILSDGENALLFDPSDPNSMRHAIVRLVKDAILRERLGANAKRTITEKGYTWHRNAERVSQLFESSCRR